MSNFATSVAHYMTTPVHTVLQSDLLPVVQQRLQSHRISSLAVIDDAERPVGVISRTDLIRVGRLQSGSRPSAALMVLPEKPVSEVMTQGVVKVAREDSVRTAAQKMVELHVHRVFVCEEQRLVGVLSTKDVMAAIVAEKVRQPISAFMSTPLFTIRAQEPVSLATERLGNAQVSGVVVVDEGWPVGMFTQAESLMSADWPRHTPVEEVMSHSLVCMNVDTLMHRAAAQAAATRTRRVIAVEQRRMKGILTGIDFAKATCA